MAHFAKIEDGVVTSVIVAEQEYIDSQEGFWVQTSYNLSAGVHTDPETGEKTSSGLTGGRARGNYAGVGMFYDSELDVFHHEQPFPSWTLNGNTGMWDAPVPYPSDGSAYEWNEQTQSWETG
jgi:hypothetical protein